MKYYKFEEDSLFDDGTTYVETALGCILRQIIVGGGQFVGSNINHREWSFVLPEGCFNYDEIEDVTAVAKEEFDAFWSQHLAQHLDKWKTVKALYPLGREIAGAILIFYPQGVVVDLGSGALGIADYSHCRASAQPEWMYPRHSVRAVVAGYDEENQWVKLQRPQVLPECC